jgi:hypothetical protein
VHDQRAVVAALSRALADLSRARTDTAPLENVIVSIVRDIAQAAVVAGHAPANAVALIASADVALLSGDPQKAVILLTHAAGRLSGSAGG